MLTTILEKLGFEEKRVLKAVLIGLIASLYFLYKNEFDITRVAVSVVSTTKEITQAVRDKIMLGRWAPRNAEQEETIVRRGGYVGGLVNDGNTCFMNSVLQCLASSKELHKFMDTIILDSNDDSQNTIDENGEESDLPNEQSTVEKKPKATKNKTYGKRKKIAVRQADNELLKNSTEPNMHFTLALQDLFSKLNAKHYRNRPWFKTNKLLKTMSKAPNRNIILGYDQEDAQEFFQTILSELEKNVESIYGKPEKDPKPVPQDDLPEDAIVGQEHLGEIGDVYIPTEQIDPNSVLASGRKFYSPYKIVTPLDGITAERIGCLQCGENGGIRYSVFSGLSLNLPSDNIGSPIKLSQLLDEWSKPEIIEGVDCNRCALNAVLEHLVEQLNTIQSQPDVNQKLVTLMEDRINEVKSVLSKLAIDDDDYKRMHTENMVRKSSKSKQILISRPPPLLSVHINRSVFDPRTYMIRKNNSRVIFKSKLNLSPWCCNYDKINLDARLPMSKKQENWHESSEDDNNGTEYYNKLHRRFEKEFEDSDEEEDGSDNGQGMFNGSSRMVEEHDVLNGELSSASLSSSEDDIAEVEEVELDALGNTIVKKTAKKPLLGGNQDVSISRGNLDIVDAEGNSEQEDDPEDDDEDEAYEEDEAEEDEENSEEESDDSLPTPPLPPTQPIVSSVPAGPLTYVLRSVIVHYGTHNYGHYIAFRRFRGCWWRISDESVYIVDEQEVLSTPGVFMLFYEYDYDTETGKMKDDTEYENEFNVEIEGEPAVDQVTH
ncbi:ubiquitin-specific protease UBP1 [Kluyveromyces lactis]|uniref:Ubiquitin carboxyl-terminal hydrolase n=1 Tax=Kluyveromyces lactis (strain ATCC 8585 / CBS 2359 / DSM 70799 / NBRC 1267 / NRRL Y-1140 / WM37) TaxID=284590 RepID=Q6CNZ3_KLULA|nr:uncharacterized protein KLLA0_E08801g [Kluyveromyces lactis]CAG99433.1 KLLA0E08801p [Kluyveromyces lactis]|eukprot:XP_454346.1 uncharacterized protein KLLA0_E08801g [Kluyveromyces lactis]